ncbi:hypothetical protein QL285_097157 [Trifolium repens]|jgi:hypothetical protein|nr:hypothetical protein QL285_097157 [Trifolium repens]
MMRLLGPIIPPSKDNPLFTLKLGSEAPPWCVVCIPAEYMLVRECYSACRYEHDVYYDLIFEDLSLSTHYMAWLVTERST